MQLSEFYKARGLFFLETLTALPKIYFKNSDFELEVIRIKGKIKGPTLLIFGGIHGDEEGGFSSAEVLSQIKLIRGNLIIVPRVSRERVLWSPTCTAAGRGPFLLRMRALFK